MLETVLGGVAFAIFLFSQIAAVIAVSAARDSGQSPAHDAIRRDRGARVIWDPAN